VNRQCLKEVGQAALSCYTGSAGQTLCESHKNGRKGVEKGYERAKKVNEGFKGTFARMGQPQHSLLLSEGEGK